MADGRPRIGIGHVTLRVSDVAKAEAFYRGLGMRPIVLRDGMAILELRGGTHLLLFHADGQPPAGEIHSFDLMVDEVPTFRDELNRAGADVSEIERDERGGHLYFTVKDPDGYVLTVYSSHVSGR